MKEKDVQTLFGKQNEKHGVFELKLCKGTSIRWDAVKEHQIEALARVKSGRFYYKIPDSPVSTTTGTQGFRFTKQKPFDCMRLPQLSAYVVVVWYVPGKRKTAYYIDVDVFLSYKLKAVRKSFREDEANSMACYIIDLKNK